MIKISLECLHCKKPSQASVAGLRTARSWKCSSCCALSALSNSQRAEIDAKAAMIPTINSRYPR
jgi:transposase-like protein